MSAREAIITGEPLPAQLPFFRAKARHIAYGGARGPGKSWAMRRKLVLLCFTYPNLKVLLLRRTLPELRENHILPLLGELNGICRYSDDQKAFVFPNGSRLRLGYCDAERDVYQYQGTEFDVVGFEEATHFTQTMIEFILTANRSTRTDFSPRAYYTANPGNVGHAWFKRLFVDRQFQGHERPEDYVFFRAKLSDNPILEGADPSYRRTLENLPDDLRRAHLEGDWDVFAGQVFKEFRREIHTVEPFPIPDHWRRWVSNDPGYNDAATWYWHCADELGQVFTYREWTISQKTEQQVGQATAWMQAKRVKELSGSERLDFVVTGFDAFAKRGDAPKTFADHYAEAGLGWPLQPQVGNDRSRFSRRMIIHEYLRPYVVPAIPANGRPGQPARTTAKVQIFSTCRELIRTLPLLVYDDANTEQVADSKDDHYYDGWSYGLQAWHARRTATPEKPVFVPGTAGDILGHARKLAGGEKVRGPFS